MKHEPRFLIGALVAVALAAALVLIVAMSQSAHAQAGSIIYVDVDATGFDNGGSWKHAYTDMDVALTEAGPLDQIWVAAGTYKPSHEFIEGDPRSAAFQMVNGVAIYGGFAPDEGVTRFEDRNWVAHETTLSGNIGDEDNPDDNSYHVFYHGDDLWLDDSAILDGFIITAGNANEPDYPDGVLGGGMYNRDSSPTLNNIIFVENSAEEGGGMWVGANVSWDHFDTLTNVTFEGNSAIDGGAVYIDATRPITPPGGITYTNCIFLGNSAERGGALFITWGEPDSGDTPALRLTNCIFWGNTADLGGALFTVGGKQRVDEPPLSLTNCIFWDNDADLGGGVFLTDTMPFRVTNCTFSRNQAESGAGIYVGKGLGPGEGWLELTNSILWGDTGDEIYLEDGVGLPIVTYSDIEGGYEGEGNIDEDPAFVDPESGDLHLLPGSVCIDSANNGPELAQYDIDGDLRILDGDGDGYAVVDMGADEFKMPTPTIEVEIEVTPEIPNNVIRVRPWVMVDVAILTTDEFDAADVAPDTVVFAGALSEFTELKDVNGDGDLDLLLYFYAREMVELDEYSTEATLTGETVGGMLIEGTDEVMVK